MPHDDIIIAVSTVSIDPPTTDPIGGIASMTTTDGDAFVVSRCADPRQVSLHRANDRKAARLIVQVRDIPALVQMLWTAHHTQSPVIEQLDEALRKELRGDGGA